MCTAWASAAATASRGVVTKSERVLVLLVVVRTDLQVVHHGAATTVTLHCNMSLPSLAAFPFDRPRSWQITPASPFSTSFYCQSQQQQ